MSEESKRAITQTELEQLCAPFSLDEHSIREGAQAGSKQLWWAYIDQLALRERLDEVFPGQWDFHVLEIYRSERYISVRVRLTIRGIVREEVGGYEARKLRDGSLEEMNHESEKAAVTDAFRRVGAMWGMGRYLRAAPRIATQPHERGNWDAREKAATQAEKQFAAWFNKSIAPGAKPQQPPAPAHPAPPTAPPAPRPGAGPFGPANFLDIALKSMLGSAGSPITAWRFTTADGRTVLTDRLDLFREARWPVDLWIETWGTDREKPIEFDPPVIVDLRKQGGVWYIDRVQPRKDAPEPPPAASKLPPVDEEEAPPPVDEGDQPDDLAEAA